MERAGIAAAEAIWRFAVRPLPALILCGPGNNGGDGYEESPRGARARGMEVRVAALAGAEERRRPCRQKELGRPGRAIAAAGGEAMLIDSLFGTGLARPLDAALSVRLAALAAAARVRVAIDLPSGVATDDGRVLSAVPDFDLTITFQTLKPSHLLQPAARRMGRLVVADIGIAADSRLHEIGRPRLRPPGPDDHKYSGYVAVLAGEMAGASAHRRRALRAGAIMSGCSRRNRPRVPRGGEPGRVATTQIGACARTGPELATGQKRLDAPGLESAAGARRRRAQPARPVGHAALRPVPILNLARGSSQDSRRVGRQRGERARAASASGVTSAGSDIVVAAPDGRAAIAQPRSCLLASAGTGDVLTGILAAMRASGMDAYEAACAGVWLHGRAAERAGPALIADDLVDRLPAAVADCL